VRRRRRVFLLRRFEKCHKIIAIFGEGLIGSSILSALTASAGFAKELVGFSYDDAAKQPGELRHIAHRISQVAERRPMDLCILWCAGTAGFGATECDIQDELAIFRRVLELAQNSVDLYPKSKISFHLTSSAGGLFEGQKYVTRHSNPAPIRPYGHLKRSQEELLLSSSARLVKRIYRLSSVYGYIKRGHRMGLISTLIFNGIRQQVSHIFGNPSTLRDYVWCEDLGKYIARVLLDHEGKENCSIDHLVSGKPSSIYEIQGIIEGLLGRKIYLAFQDTNTNSSDITFSRIIFPDNWYPIDIETGARSIYLKWRDCGSIP